MSKPVPAFPGCVSVPVPNYADAGLVGWDPGGGQLLRWRRFPVRIALDTSTLSLVEDPGTWKTAIAAGIQAWAAATDDAIGTTIAVADASLADIVVRLSVHTLDDCLLLNCLGVVGSDAQGAYLLQARIFLYPGATAWSGDKIAQVTAHEMGHALGLMVHSPDPLDLMYGGTLPTPVAHEYPWITQRDLNTMQIAYCVLRSPLLKS